MRNWKLLGDEYDCLYMIADLHAITVRQSRRSCARSPSSCWLCCWQSGSLIREEHSLLPEPCASARRNELAAQLLHLYGRDEPHDPVQGQECQAFDNINCGLFTYPVLMAGDILLYQANLVPVGVDQTQHLEICRDIATRFNGIYGNVFTIPEGYYPKHGARVMSLQDPKRKMSKSDPDDCFVSMLDPADVVRRKLRCAVTDSGIPKSALMPKISRA